MPTAHRAVIVLSLAAFLGSCGSEVPLDKPGRDGAERVEALIAEQPALADPCADATGPGTYKAEANPGTSFYCTWNDIEIFREELVPGNCNGLP